MFSSIKLRRVGIAQTNIHMVQRWRTGRTRECHFTSRYNTREKVVEKRKKIGNLILQNLAWRDRSQDAEWTGTYQCVAENMLGQRSAIFSQILTIRDGPLTRT